MILPRAADRTAGNLTDQWSPRLSALAHCRHPTTVRCRSEHPTFRRRSRERTRSGMLRDGLLVKVMGSMAAALGRDCEQGQRGSEVPCTALTAAGPEGSVWDSRNLNDRKGRRHDRYL